tara:strand:- start:1511 stop:1762 length:252 start_codon:yes stop_codon:yes gene_type:complete
MAANLGKTAKHYKANPKSRAKHVKDNSPGGKYAHSNEYKRAHSKARASLKIRSSNVDASKQSDGSYKAESRKTNRGRGGAKRR